MAFELVNKKKAKQKAKYFHAIKEIITKHHTKSVKKIQIYLVEEYHIALAESTLKRYLGLIKKEKIKKIKEQLVAKVTKDDKITYPYYIKDPSGKEHKITSDNHTITIQWGTQGLITYDKKDKIWRYDCDSTVFDKGKKPTPYYKTRNNLSWDYGD